MLPPGGEGGVLDRLCAMPAPHILEDRGAVRRAAHALTACARRAYPIVDCETLCIPVLPKVAGSTPWR